MCQRQAMASDLPFYDMFAPTKNFSFEVSDDVIACDLGTPQPKIMATPMSGGLQVWLKLSWLNDISLLLFRVFRKASAALNVA